MEKSSACGSINHAYYLCLIDWETRILNPDELKEFSNKIMEPSAQKVDGWKIESLKWTELQDCASNIEFGFYHSRLIFKFELKSTPQDIFQVREVRKRLESKIEEFCIDRIIPVIKSYNKKASQPFIFIYPIFELNTQEDLWRFTGQKPYAFPTTCFFTEFDDRQRVFQKKVKMRISGAKIIASDMSDWFFNNLVNIVFHEGLYRQARSKSEKELSSEGPVYKGLENRLEDFASRLMTTFHEFSSEYVRRRIQKIAIIASILGITITLANLAINLWKTLQP